MGKENEPKGKLHWVVVVLFLLFWFFMILDGIRWVLD